MNTPNFFSRFFLPGNLLGSVLLFLLVLIYSVGITLIFTNNFFKENWIVLHTSSALFCGIGFKIARIYDPRKPLQDYFWNKYESKFCLFLHLLEHLVLYLWMWSLTITSIQRHEQIISHIGLGIIVFGRFLYFMWFFYKELYEKCSKTMRFYQSLECFYTLLQVLIIVSKSGNEGKQLYEFFFMFFLPISWGYSLIIFAIVSGFYRESVRQLPVQNNNVQIPLPALLDYSFGISESNRTNVCSDGTLERDPSSYEV